MTVVAPFNLQFGRIEPYVSLTELKFSPIMSAVDFTQIVPNGSRAAQDRALYEEIVRASSKIDIFCMGKLGTLNATGNTENNTMKMDRQGRFKVHPAFSPILAVTAFSWGTQMGNDWPVPLTRYSCFVKRDVFEIQAQGAQGVNAVAGMGALNFVLNRGGGRDADCFVTYTYISGWPNTFLASPVAASAEEIYLNDPTGWQPGMQGTLWDGMNDETFFVSLDYIAGTSLLTLQSPLTFKHGENCNVSTLPPGVKEACIHFVAARIKSRGQGGLSISSTGEIGGAADDKVVGSSDDEMHGYDLLDEFKQTWGQI